MKSLLVALILVFAIVGGGTAIAHSGSSAPATDNLTVRDGSNPGEVVIAWDHVPQATYYRIGYVNMVTDYPVAKASVTGEWIEAFIYVDVNARNLVVADGRTEYTIRRLEQDVLHAFTVLTTNSFVNSTEIVGSEFSWPSSPRWRYHTVADRGGVCPADCPNGQPSPPQGSTLLVLPPASNRDCYVGLQLSTGESCIWPNPTPPGAPEGNVGIVGQGDYHGQLSILWHGGDIWITSDERGIVSWTTSSSDSTWYRFQIERNAGDTWTVRKVNEPIQP